MPFLLVALLAWGIWLWSGDAEQAAQVNYSAQRNEAQDSILVGLTALNDPAVNAFVNEWRSAYPSPTLSSYRGCVSPSRTSATTPAWP